MSIVIRAADFTKDKDRLIGVLSRYLTPASDERRFDWLYRHNPHGTARAWMAMEGDSGEVVGASAAFPRRLLVNSRPMAGWVLGDFCVAERYRSLGPALRLQKATLAGVRETEDAMFWYDFPSASMAAVYNYLGINPAAQVVRLAKPLRLDGMMRNSGLNSSLGASAKWIGNRLLEISDSRMGATKWEMELHQGDCTEEFTSLRERGATPESICILKSQRYLNWRYLQHPNTQYQILTARKAKELQGYLIFSCRGEEADIAEWSTVNDSLLLPALVADLARRLRTEGICTLNAFLVDTDSRVKSLRSLGYWVRESRPVMVCWLRSAPSCSEGWLLMHGDRDS